MSGLIHYHSRHFVIEPDREHGFYWISEYRYIPSQQHAVLTSSEYFDSYLKSPVEYTAWRSGMDETVIDVFIGFSDMASRQFADKNLVATQMVEEVNNALVNSQVEGVRLDLVGTGTIPANPGVLPGIVNQIEEWFAREVNELKPDMIAFVQALTGKEGEVLGHGSLGSYISDNGFSTNSIFAPSLSSGMKWAITWEEGIVRAMAICKGSLCTWLQQPCQRLENHYVW